MCPGQLASQGTGAGTKMKVRIGNHASTGGMPMIGKDLEDTRGYARNRALQDLA
jgi:hypothetical protein